MNRLVHLWSLTLVLLTGFAFGEVVEVTDTTYSTVVDGSANVLLEFYAPWCGHCKKLAPEYEILGTRFSKEKDGVVIAKVDAQEHQALAGMFGVTGYPTLKWMPKGKSLPGEADVVKAPRTAEGLEDYVNEKIGATSKRASVPSAVLDLSSETFDSIALNPKKHALVEFFAPWCGHCKKLAPIYEKLGAAFDAEDEVVIAKVDATEGKDLASRYGVSGYPTIKYFPPGDTEPETYNGARSLEAFVEFLNEKAGTSRTADGGLKTAAGRLAALDEVLKSMPSIPAAELASRLEEAAAAAGYTSEIDKAAAGHYVRAAQKIVERGASYPETEVQRLQGLLKDTKSLSPQKKTLFQVRRNILRAFIEMGAPKASEGEAAEGADTGAGEL